MSVKARDISKLGEIIQSGLDAGANNIHGISFGLEDISEFETQARQDAIQDASARAKQLTEGIGVKLGDPISISEVGGYGGGPVYVEYSAKVGGSRCRRGGAHQPRPDYRHRTGHHHL